MQQHNQLWLVDGADEHDGNGGAKLDAVPWRNGELQHGGERDGTIYLSMA